MREGHFFKQRILKPKPELYTVPGNKSQSQQRPDKILPDW